MILRFIVAIVPLLLFAVSCGRVQSAGTEQPVTIRLSTGFPSGNFRPFSEALVRGYAQLMPDIRIELIDTSGSVGNIQGLQDGVVDIGLSQAGIAYMAYNGRLRESGRAMRGIRGIAILNSSAVHLLVGPGSPLRSMDELRRRRVGVGPDGSGAAVISQALLHGYFSPGDVHEVGATVPQTNSMLLENALDAAFTISSVPNDDAKQLTDGGCAADPDPRTGRGPVANDVSLLPSEVIPAGSYRGHGSART